MAVAAWIPACKERFLVAYPAESDAREVELAPVDALLVASVVKIDALGLADLYARSVASRKVLASVASVEPADLCSDMAGGQVSSENQRCEC